VTTKLLRRAPLAPMKSQKAGHMSLNTVAAITIEITMEDVMTLMVAIEAAIVKNIITIITMEEMGVDTSRKMTIGMTDTEEDIVSRTMTIGMADIEEDMVSRKIAT